MRNHSAALSRAPDVQVAAAAATVSTQSKPASVAALPMALPFRRREIIPEGLRQEMIRKAAYLRAQARGFAPGHELEDWFEAEQEVSEVIIRRYG